MRRLKTRIIQPGYSGAPGFVTFTDSAAISDDCHESSSAARMLPVYPLLNIESGDIVEIKAMPDEEEILNEVRAAFEREPRIDPHHYPIRMEIAEDGALILEGTVRNVAAKKLGLELAAAAPGARAIVDRLKVAPSAPMTDDKICDHVRNALLQEPTMLNCAIRVRAKGRVENVRAAMAEPSGFIEVAVEDGNVLLSLQGTRPSRSSRNRSSQS